MGGREFPATATGYAQLLGWLGGFGGIALVGVEGSGSYGAGIACHLAAAGVLFFFLAEDGIRDRTVTGVQTCALPISRSSGRGAPPAARQRSASPVITRA